MNYDCIIIGGGASGLFAGVLISRQGKRVAIFEHNEKLGKKLAITGKGRCNVTNNSSVEEVLKNIPTNSRFMYSSLNNFSPSDTMNFFEDLGVKLKTERGNRVFPESDSAKEIVNSLYQELVNNNVKLIFDKVTDIIIEDEKITGVKSHQKTFTSDIVIVATGGASYPTTGSTGDGYLFAKKAGHTITELKPSLVPIVIRERFCSELMGLSLKNVVLSVKDTHNNKVLFSDIGEMLFTHFGVSGPLVLSASSLIKESMQERYLLIIDLKPGLSEEQLDLRVQRDFQLFSNKILVNSLNKLLPANLIPVIIKSSGLDSDIKVNQITKKQRLDLVKTIKAFTIHFKDFRPVSEAIITSGGVNVKEINPKTMESKIIKGLYFIGEILDVDAYTGGFNLQIAFSTANSVAKNI